MQVESDKDAHYATLEMITPIMYDNSGYKPTVVSIPALEDIMKFKIGPSKVIVEAADLSGNTAKCVFTITVTGLLMRSAL